MTNKTNSIINVTVNGLTANEAIASVKLRLETVEKSAFNIALLCAYTLGDTIPSYVDNKGNEHGEAVCEKPIKKQADLLKLIGRSKATLSRWIKAVRLIIEKGYFTEFSNGSLPFSYDKVILIFENEEAFEGYVLADLMSMTVDTLEAMTETASEDDSEDDSAEDTEEGSEDDSEDDSKDEEETASEEVTTIIYNGEEYTVNKVAFEKWLSDNAIVE